MSKKEREFYCKLGQAVTNIFCMLALGGAFAGYILYAFLG